MGERGRSLDSRYNRKSDSDRSSHSFYSDGDSSHASDHSPTASTQSTNTVEKSNKEQNLKSLARYQATKQLVSKYAPSKRGIRWGFRSQSLNREPPAKDISLVTKKVLSARLQKINELQNELSELHVKLDEREKENRALKRLQYRQEKALHKFEDTENEISKLLARHNDDIRILRDRLRKSQDREQTTERKLRTAEDELYKVRGTVQKLKQVAEDRHLLERVELAKRLAVAENRLADSEKRIKDLERNLELSNSSFQRQLHSEKKKLNETQEKNKALQEEVNQLHQKLKEKERELDARNIYVNRMLKPSPKKDADKWEKEESEKKMKENSLWQEKEERAKAETGIYSLDNGMKNSEKAEEEKRKENLLAKMYEIDRETQMSLKMSPQEHTLQTYFEKSKCLYQFSEAPKKLSNGFLENDLHNMVTKGVVEEQENTEASSSSTYLTFGSYVPSFGKVTVRPNWLNQKSHKSEEPAKENFSLNINQERKLNLMEQLFGHSVHTITPAKINDLDSFQEDHGTNNGFQDKSTKVKGDSNLFLSEEKSFHPKRHHLQHTASRSAVKAFDYLEDEIEEVLLK
uniref:Lebercilin LCA5 n=1 Tax=Salvator merianae TaxID=96440 RepID=A0A8D0KFP7_SALMN